MNDMIESQMKTMREQLAAAGVHGRQHVAFLLCMVILALPELSRKSSSGKIPLAERLKSYLPEDRIVEFSFGEAALEQPVSLDEVKAVFAAERMKGVRLPEIVLNLVNRLLLQESDQRGSLWAWSPSVSEALYGWVKSADKLIVDDTPPFSPLVARLALESKPIQWLSQSKFKVFAELFEACTGKRVDFCARPSMLENGEAFAPKTDASLASIPTFDPQNVENVLQTMLSSVSGRIAILLPGFAAARFDSLKIWREQLLVSKRLYAVVDFPNNMGTWTAMPVSLYLINASDKPSEQVRMVSFQDEELFEKRPSGRGVRVFSPDGEKFLRTVMKNGPLSKHELLVPATQILETPQVDLSTARYVMSSVDASMVERIEQFSRTLGNVAVIVRPLPLKNLLDSEGTDYYEVTGGLTDQAGVINEASRTVQIDESRVTRGFANTLVRDGDIVFALKGKAGACGLILGERENWIISQSSVVVRLKPSATGITPKTLLRYLRSGMVQTYLKINEIKGSGVPFMSVKGLENLPIPILPEDDLAKQDSLFDEQVEIVAQIEKLKGKVANLQMVEFLDAWG